MSCVMFRENAKESLYRAKQSSMNHDWTLSRAVSGCIFQIESLWQIKVELNRRHLPGTTNCIASLN